MLTGRTFPQRRRNLNLKYTLPEKTEGIYRTLIKNEVLNGLPSGTSIKSKKMI